LLEVIALILLAQDSGYQRSRLVGLNRQVSGFFYERTNASREYLSLKQANEVLVGENARLRNQLDQLTQALDSTLVRSLYKEPYHYNYVPARVVHNSVYKQYNYMTLNKGKKDGVFADMGVISEEGLVGIVLESSRNYATVIPVINLDFRLSVKLKSNNYAGILQWEGKSPLSARLNEIPFHVEISDRDTLVTSGFSSIFPEGIVVGTIESHTLDQGNFYDIHVKLSTDFQRLFHVNVIRNFRQEEQLELEDLR
jgi:rod shape-determining protein MreC